MFTKAGHNIVGLNLSSACLLVKETFSLELRRLLLDINWKLFSRDIVAHHKILILLKAYFAIYKKSYKFA